MLHVALKDKSYDIKIKRNGLKECGQWVSELWTPQKVAVISDSRVAPLYAQMVLDALKEENFTPYLFVVPEGEASKSFKQAQILYDKMTDADFTRSDGVIALGGGVIGDLAGFVASTYMRGLHFLQIPTSLLAQVDSSIGGKTAVNTDKAKNLVGTFSQPDGVLIDPQVLDTLEDRILQEGIAEIIKAAAIADLKLWHLLETIEDEFELRERAEEVLLPSLIVKKEVVEADEFDQGSRLILNFGHTIGHALEKNAGYGTISHGEGVAMGMIAISTHAEKIGQTPSGTTKKLKKMIQKYHIPLQQKKRRQTSTLSNNHA